MARAALTLVCCAALGGMAQGETCQIMQLTDLEGTIRRLPGDVECAWHINPKVRLQRIEFVATESAFEGADRLSFYVTAAPSATRTRKIASFSRWAPLPRKMQLTGTDEVLLLWAGASDSSSYFELSYKCFPAGHRLGGVYLSTLAYIAVLSAASITTALVLAAPMYLICFCRAKLRQDAAMQASEVVRRAELANRRRESTETRIRAAIAEARTAGALEALPIERWQGVKGEADTECCLCLEQYSLDDILRVLPCSHFFHKDCVDRWFAARRFMPRTCPLCKRDPVAPGDLESVGRPPQGGLEVDGVPTPTHAWAAPDSTGAVPMPATYGRGAAQQRAGSGELPAGADDLDMQAVDTE